MRRFLIGIAAALGSALTLTSLTGCAAAEEPGSLQNQNPLGSYVNNLRELPGVESVELDVKGTRTDIYGLDVKLRDDISADELFAIGAEASGFAETASNAGLTASQPELSRGESTFQYFDNLDTDALASQLGYWMQLQRDGIEAISMSGYTERVTTMRQDATTAAQPDPRYVAIELPDSVDAGRVDAIMSDLRKVHDPGSAQGQWDVVVPSAHFKAEFHAAKFPSETEFGYVSTVATTFMQLDNLASVEVAYYPDNDVPLQVEVVSFDNASENLTAEEADAAFQESPVWEQLRPLMAAFGDKINYRVEVLGNPLSDGGNFKFDFTVADCAFTGDTQWPASSAALGEIWQHAMKDAHAKCTPELAPTP